MKKLHRLLPRRHKVKIYVGILTIFIVIPSLILVNVAASMLAYYITQILIKG